jgi:uncharacterized membrane protein YhaH (DUF805 family)
MSPIDFALQPLKKYATFTGRASRAEFWWFFLFTMIFYLVLMFVVGMIAGTGMMAANPGSALMTGTFGVSTMLVGLFWLALFVPTLAVQIRRLHDTNRSGWWIGVFWLLYVGYMVMLFSTMAGATPDAPPNLGMAAGVGIFALVFMVYSIVLLVFFCLRGTVGPNSYGEDPYGPDVEQVFA